MRRKGMQKPLPAPIAAAREHRRLEREQAAIQAASLRRDLCEHPIAHVTVNPLNPAQAACGLCGASGSVMTKSPGGVLVPKVWK